MTTTFSFNAMRLPWPADWGAIFDRAAPLLVEIGFGNGAFLADLALHHPEANIIGIERAHSPMTWTEERVAKKDLSNVRLVFGDALMALCCLFPPDSVHAFHLNFSDPWPKKRHHKRRLINEEFLKVLASRLEPNGHVFIATDILHYAGEIGLALTNTAGLKNTYHAPWALEREDTRIRTHYERKAIAAGRDCHYFKWRRTETPIQHRPVVLEEAMPNARLNLPFDLDRVEAEFAPITIQNESRVARLSALYRQVGQGRLLFEVYIEEPLFTQRLMLTLEAREGEYLLNMGSVGHPRATRGVHDAAYHLMQWLTALHPESHVISHTIRLPDSTS